MGSTVKSRKRSKSPGVRTRSRDSSKKKKTTAKTSRGKSKTKAKAKAKTKTKTKAEVKGKKKTSRAKKIEETSSLTTANVANDNDGRLLSAINYSFSNMTYNEILNLAKAANMRLEQLDQGQLEDDEKIPSSVPKPAALERQDSDFDDEVLWLGFSQFWEKARRQYLDGEFKPILRGFLHQLVFAVVFPIAFYFMYVGASEDNKQHVVIYMLCSGFLYLSSFIFHRYDWGEYEPFAHSNDRSAIFCMIAGSHHPLAVIKADIVWRNYMMAILWVGCLYFCVTEWLHAKDYLNAAKMKSSTSALKKTLVMAFYMFVLGLFLLEAMFWRQSTTHYQNLCIFFIWLQYFLGAASYALRWPFGDNPVFGHHEIFHLLVFTASGTTYAMNYDLLCNNN